eukprot:m.154592 g.154592  ORF g.154592 m.154592 type:complete len:95 (-) comp23519_c0_seq1:1527-1811(-)
MLVFLLCRTPGIYKKDSSLAQGLVDSGSRVGDRSSTALAAEILGRPTFAGDCAFAHAVCRFTSARVNTSASAPTVGLSIGLAHVHGGLAAMRGG